MSGGVYVNGRPAADFEVAAVERGRECEMERDRELLAGLLAEYPRPPEPAPRPMSTLPLPELR